MITHAKLPLFGAIACVSLLIAQSFSATAARAMEDEAAAPQRSAEPAAAYTRLYESIMIRKGRDGKNYGTNALDPLLVWPPSKFLLKGKSRERLIAALEAFAAQPSRKFEVYTEVQRAIMQRLLWAVFDWTAKRGGNASERKRALQRKLVPIIRRLSLSYEEINALPDNFAATVKADRYSQAPDPKDLFKSFFPATLFAPESSWICMTTSDTSAKSPLPAQTHSRDKLYRSAFTLFIRLSGGRDQTLQYLNDLANFRDHWTTEGTGRRRGSNVSRNRKTPRFPPGTQFALVRQALLISDAGKLVVSPLIESVQVRAYLLGHDKAVAEFLMEPTKLIAGETILRARHVDETGLKLFLAGGSDPLDPGSTRSLSSATQRSILGHCNICHSKSNIHSVASRLERFNLLNGGGNPHVIPPQFLEGKPEDVWNGTIREKRATYSWGLLQGIWHK